MRPRVVIICATAVLIAAGAGVAVWTATRPSAPATPSSPLNAASPLTCPDQARSCTSPGTVRWSVPLPGKYELDGGPEGLTIPQARVSSNSGVFTLFPSPYPAAVSADGLILYQQGALVQAIDPATGNVRWRANLDPGHTLWNAWGTALAQGPVAAGDQVAVEAVTGDDAAAWVWLLDAASGAVRARVPLSPNEDPELAVLAPTASGLAVDLGSCGAIESLAWDTGSVSWRVSLPGTSQPFSAGSTAYCPEGSTVQPVDLDTGSMLPALPLPAGLQGTTTSVATVTPRGTLVATGITTVAGISVATGRVLWSANGRLSIDGNKDALLLLPDPASSVPAGAYLEQVPGSPGYRLVMVQLDTGQPMWTATLSSALFSDYASGNLLQGLNRLVYDSAIVTDSPASWIAAPQPGGVWTRLEGLDPRTGRTRWTGPWTSAYTQVIGQTTGRPAEIIALSCAPDGAHLAGPVSGLYPDGSCTAPRVFAVNG